MSLFEHSRKNEPPPWLQSYGYRATVAALMPHDDRKRRLVLLSREAGGLTALRLAIVQVGDELAVKATTKMAVGRSVPLERSGLRLIEESVALPLH